MRKLRRLVPVVAVLGVVAVVPATVATAPGDNGRIAWSRDGTMYTMAPDGSDRLRLTDVGFFGFPVWSPGGKKLAVVRWRTTPDERNRIVVMGPEGQNPRVVARARFEIASVSWAPSGRRLVYCDLDVSNHLESAPYPAVLRIVDVATGEQTRISNWADRGCGSSWSPDGGWIAYTAGDSTDVDVHAIRPDGTQAHVVWTDPDARQFDVTWSPSGNRIGFSSSVPNENGVGDALARIQTVRPNGTGLKTFTDPLDFFDRTPQWSPDGSLLLFSRQDAAFEEEAQLAIIDAAGSDPLLLGPGELNDAVWSPDSQWIVYSRGGNVFRIRPDGTDGEALVGSATNWDSNVSWQAR